MEQATPDETNGSAAPEPNKGKRSRKAKGPVLVHPPADQDPISPEGAEKPVNTDTLTSQDVKKFEEAWTAVRRKRQALNEEASGIVKRFVDAGGNKAASQMYRKLIAMEGSDAAATWDALNFMVETGSLKAQLDLFEQKADMEASAAPPV